jgi:HAD superfamily hydrolase (TIGR01509 family)
MIKAVIFDMDGTIADSEKIVKKVSREFFEERGINLTKKEEKIIFGLTWKEFVKKILESRGKKYKQSIKNTLKERYVRTMSREVEAIPGVYEVLEVVSRNFKVALATNSRWREVEIIFNKLKFHKYFHLKLAKNHVKNGKPDPEIYLKAAELLKVKPEECVVFEDSVVGIEAAKAAGMKCVGIVNTYSRKDLKKADMLIDSYHQINLEKIKKLGEKTRK